MFYNQRRKAVVGSTGGKLSAIDGGKIAGQGAKGGSSSAYNALGLGSYSLTNNTSLSQQQFSYDLK